MKIRRHVTDEEWALFSTDPYEFMGREIKRVTEYVKNNPSLNKYPAVIARILVYNMEALVELDSKASDGLLEPEDADAYKVKEDETEMDMDPLSADKSTGGYRLTAFLPGVEEGEIKIDVRNGVLALYAGKYKKEFNVPRSVCEIRKTYRNGVLDIRLV